MSLHFKTGEARHTATWMNLESIMLTEIRLPVTRDKYLMIPLIMRHLGGQIPRNRVEGCFSGAKRRKKRVVTS